MKRFAEESRAKANCLVMWPEIMFILPAFSLLLKGSIELCLSDVAHVHHLDVDVATTSFPDSIFQHHYKMCRTLGTALNISRVIDERMNRSTQKYIFSVSFVSTT